MMQGLDFILYVIKGFFSLFDTPILGIPIYAYFVFVFVMGMIAKFIVGRR